ncbi:MAG: DUF6807 family protein [Luteolibacter sp.]
MIRPNHLAAFAVSLATAHAQWSSELKDGTATANFGDAHQITYQIQPLTHPTASNAFLPSAFLHPLKTPAGFEWTAVMPADHIHHLGLWWPWKYIEVDGKKYNCWELQNGEGAHHARTAKVVSSGPDAVEWELENEIRVRKAGKNAGPPVTDGIPVIRESVRMRIARHGADANVLDIEIRQVAVEKPVRIINFRYSGFCWRGPESWDHKNSVMTTDKSLTRDQANGSEGRWVLVTGPAGENATASVLMMSAAVEIAEAPERLRVWDSKAHHGTPFVNFNPVQQNALTLDAENPAVSHRQYRLIAADRTLTPEEAEAEWKAWREASK